MGLFADPIVEPKIAPIKYRISAAIIDFLIIWLLGFLIGYLFCDYHANDDATGYHLTGFPAFLLFAIEFGLISIQEGLTGQTIGKRIVRIRVIKEGANDSSLSSSIIRHLFDIVDMFFLIGIFVAASGQKKQRVGDSRHH